MLDMAPFAALRVTESSQPAPVAGSILEETHSRLAITEEPMKLTPAPAAVLLAALAFTSLRRRHRARRQLRSAHHRLRHQTRHRGSSAGYRGRGQGHRRRGRRGYRDQREQETENGELIYEVQVRTPDGVMEVEVFASNGGVAEIEPAD